jgi:hypothetical protein
MESVEAWAETYIEEVARALVAYDTRSSDQ